MCARNGSIFSLCACGQGPIFFSLSCPAQIEDAVGAEGYWEREVVGFIKNNKGMTDSCKDDVLLYLKVFSLACVYMHVSSISHP